MPVSPEAISQFLAWKPAQAPSFKGADPTEIRQTLEDLIGAPFASVGPPARPHQLEGLAFALWQKRALLYYSMRTGKTKIALDWLRALRQAKWSLGKALIIAHSPIGVDVWEGQAAQHSDLKIQTVHSGKDALEQFLAAAEGPQEAVVVAWSTLQAIFSVKALNRKAKVKRYADEEILDLVAPYFTALVIDEIHLTGNHLSLRFSIASHLASHCQYRLGLTGTPIGRDPFKLWASTYLIDEGETLSRNYYFFEIVFGKKKLNFFTKRPEMLFDKTKLGILKERLTARSMSYELAEIQTIDVLRGLVELRMFGEQREAYEKAIAHIIELRRGETQEVTSAFVQLRQIASGFLTFVNNAGEKRTYVFPQSAKLEWIAEFLEEYDGSTQCVIFHEFIRSGALICDRLARAKIAHRWLHGGIKDRKEVISAFQAGKARILVANTATGGLSVDLPMADYLLFFESPVSPTIRLQAEARPMARGNRPLLLDDLICSPIERRVLGFVQEGKDMLSAILRDPKLLLG